MTPLNQLDVVFISYDEPNAEENYAKLCEIAPWAKRVHGVKGSDAAHKAAARLSETSRFISVDADNVVDPEFFNQEINFEHEKFKDKVVSWSATNIINGLEYGNGGLKCWPVEFVLNMKSHEEAETEQHAVDFCWDNKYVQMNNKYCTTVNNASPLQAWRAGFREGVKMSLNRGLKIPKEEFKNTVWYGNMQRLMIWMNVGSDVKNGLWAMLGARHGCYKTNLTDWDFVNVRDFECLVEIFKDVEHFNSEQLLEAIEYYGIEIQNGLGIDIPDILNTKQSSFFKQVYNGVPRTGTLVTEEELSKLRKINK